MKKELFTIILLLLANFCFAQNDTTYFDKDWKICTRTEANYYRIINQIEGHFIVTDYYINNKPQMVSFCSSVDPIVKNGKIFFYNENGTRKGEGQYKNNKESGIWIWWDENEIDSTIAEYNANGTKTYTRLSKGFKSKNENEIYEMVDEMPSYPDGIDAMFNFIANEFKLPEVDKIAGTKGRFLITFVVDENGNIINPVIFKSLSKTCDEEALRMIAKMPKWTPGKLDGKNVKVKLSIPIKIS